MTMGDHTVTVDDSGIISTASVTVTHGLAIDTRIQISPPNLIVGQQSAVIIQAYDLAGNTWTVNGTIDVLIGNEMAIEEQGDYYTLIPDATGAYAVKGNGSTKNLEFCLIPRLLNKLVQENLPKLNLMAREKIPIDQPFDLNPRFFGANGNQLDDIFVNWTIDGEDQTLVMSLVITGYQHRLVAMRYKQCCRCIFRSFTDGFSRRSKANNYQ